MTKKEYIEVTSRFPWVEGDKIHIHAASEGINDDFVVEKIVEKTQYKVRLYLKLVRKTK